MNISLRKLLCKDFLTEEILDPWQYGGNWVILRLPIHPERI